MPDIIVNEIPIQFFDLTKGGHNAESYRLSPDKKTLMIPRSFVHYKEVAYSYYEEFADNGILVISDRGEIGRDRGVNCSICFKKAGGTLRLESQLSSDWYRELPWFKIIKSSDHLEQNPFNRNLHSYLKGTEPKYETANLYVTYSGRFYGKVKGNWSYLQPYYPWWDTVSEECWAEVEMYKHIVGKDNVPVASPEDDH